jgi:hypothetical protein
LKFEVELHGPTQVLLKEPGGKVGGYFDQSELWLEEGGGACAAPVGDKEVEAHPLSWPTVEICKWIDVND